MNPVTQIAVDLIIARLAIRTQEVTRGERTESAVSEAIIILESLRERWTLEGVRELFDRHAALLDRFAWRMDSVAGLQRAYFELSVARNALHRLALADPPAEAETTT